MAGTLGCKFDASRHNTSMKLCACPHELSSANSPLAHSASHKQLFSIIPSRITDMPKALVAVALFFVFTMLAGCGGNSAQNGTPTPTPTPTPTALTVTCPGCNGGAVVPFGSSVQFQATANGGGVTPPVNWFVDGVQGGNSTDGTINASGLFTAPNPFDSGKSVTVMAQEQSNSSATGSIAVVIVNNTSKQTPPVMMGTSGGNVNDSVTSGTTITCCSGTLGSLINKGGTLFILSNNHVLDKSSFGTIGDAIGQPGLIDNQCQAGQTVANLTQAAALKPNPCTGVCTGPSPSNVDAAIATVNGNVDTSGNILDLGAVNGATINPAPPSSMIALPSSVLGSNEGVAKVGRSSGLTCSNLSSVNTSVQVDYNSSCGGSKAFTATFSNQVIVNGGSFSAAGDSGSLIVTSDTARPVALLFAGNSSSTSANPIGDLMTAFGSFTFVGGGDHAVSCSAVGMSGTTMAAASSASLSTQERARVAAVQQRRAAALKQDPAVESVEIGASQDSPGEGALVVRVSGETSLPIPAVVDGVRTAVVSTETATRAPQLSSQEMENARAVKEAHAAEWMSHSGIQGIGVGRSDDNPAEAAIVIYTVTGIAHPAIPKTLEGVRTKIIVGDRFRAYGWGKETKPATRCVKKQ